MAATILAKDVLRRVSVQLTDAPDAAGQFERWTERELVDWLNDGQRVIAKYLPSSCARIDVIKLTAGTRQSIEKVLATNIKNGDGLAATDLRGKILLDVVRNMGADGATPGRSVRVVAREQLDASSPTWHQEKASSVREFTYDPRTPNYFYVYPGADPAASVWVEVAWLVNPAEIPYLQDSMRIDGASTALISIDDEFVDDLVNYMLARAQMKDAEVAGNSNLAAGFTNLFVSSINAQAKALTGVNPNLKTLPFTPDAPGAAS